MNFQVQMCSQHASSLRSFVGISAWIVAFSSFYAFEVQAQAPAAAPKPDTKGQYQTRLLIANADGSNIRTVMHLPEFLANGSPSVSADGTLMAIDGWRPEQGEKYSEAQIIVFNSDGTNIRVLGDGAMPSLSPQGKRIVYSRYSPNYGIWLMDIGDEDSEPIQIDDRGWGTDWSPDGTRIAFSKRDNNMDNMCVYSLVEGDKRLLFGEGQSPYRQIMWNFSWSPDSQFIAFRGDRQDGISELAVIDARGAQFGLIKCYEGPLDHQVAWTPDGKVIFGKTKDKKYQMYTMDPSHPEQPAELLPLAPDRSVFGGIFTRDAQQILFIMNRPLPDFAKK